MFLNLCTFGKSVLCPCKFVLLSAYYRQINRSLHTSAEALWRCLSWGGLPCSAQEAAASQLWVTRVCQINAVDKWHGKRCGFLCKLASASADCGRPWGFSQYPVGHQKAIPGTRGPWEGDFALRWPLQGELSKQPLQLASGHHPASPCTLCSKVLGAGHTSRCPTTLVLDPLHLWWGILLCQPATTKSLLAQARLKWSANGRATLKTVKGGTNACKRKQLESW